MFPNYRSKYISNELKVGEVIFMFSFRSLTLLLLSVLMWETRKFGFSKRVDKGRNYHRERFGKLTFRALALRQRKFALTVAYRSKRQLSKSFTVVIRPLSTRSIKPNFLVSLSHRRSTTDSLETRNLCNVGKPGWPAGFVLATAFRQP